MTRASEHPAAPAEAPAQPTPGDDRLEREIRARYTDAAAHLSARTQAQLRLRLRAAMADAHMATPRTTTSRTGKAHPSFWLATACSMALLVVAGVHWNAGREAAAPASAELALTQRASIKPASTKHEATQPARVATKADDAGEFVATLDESPDLYLWLASDDATALFTE